MQKSELMLALVEEYRNCGQSVSAFCEQRDLKASTFRYWMRKANAGTLNAGRFIPIHSKDAPSKREVRVSYPNGVSVDLVNPELSLIGQLIHLF